MQQSEGAFNGSTLERNLTRSTDVSGSFARVKLEQAQFGQN